MMTTPSSDPWPSTWEPAPQTPPAPAARPTTVGAWNAPAEPAGLGDWIDRRRQDLTHPQVVEEELRRAGWHPMHAAIEANRYRTRFNEHTLGYAALLVSTGVAALALGTLGHALAAGIDGTVNRNRIAFWLTLALIALPFAVWGHLWATRVDRDDPVAVWSQPRRSLALALVWGCGIVGFGRLAYYGAQLIGTVVGATWAIHGSVAAGLVNVSITVGIALPLGLWAFHFLHRFDNEDPTRTPVPHRNAR
jgi:hypothetical protein